MADDSELPSVGDSLSDAGVVDSAGILTLIVALEAEFEIVVEDEDVHPANLDSIESLTEFVLRKQLSCEGEA